MRHPAHFLAFGFGAGLASAAPGTWGTLVAFPLYFALVDLPVMAYWAVISVMALSGIWICDTTGRALGVQDHGGIVWDEIVAMLVVLPFAPPNLWGYLLAFALFRLFDIWKPFPIRWLDSHVHGGVGVMLDDLAAGLYAILVLWGIRAWL